MRAEDYRHLLRHEPFEPFRLVITDGTTYDIRHPELLLVERSFLRVCFPAANLPVPLTNREVLVSLLHIMRVEPLAPPELPSTNGA